MSIAEQPPKKRKLYDAFPDAQIPPVQNHRGSSSSPPPPPPSQEEILRKRRNREEIRSLVDCYRKIRFCASQKDARLMPELEQAYLSLITASRGCMSVQRVVAELIPRYASYCPTALEAAAKVSINMYNWSLSIVMRGDDVDAVAYETAKICILGLVEICCTASHEAPTSSVIQGICAAVFFNVLIFFISTFEGKDIYQIGSRDILKLQEPMDLLDDLKQESIDNNESALNKLFKLRALGLLCIFFSSPRNLLQACFELLASGGTEVALNKGGQYFLNQVTSHLNDVDITHVLDKKIDGPSLCTDSASTSIGSAGKNQVIPVANDDTVLEKTLLISSNCFLGMAFKRDSSLRAWVLSEYKKLSQSLNPQATLELSSFLDKVFGSVSKIVNEIDFEERDGDKIGFSNCMKDPHLANRAVLQQGRNANVSRELSSGVCEASCSDISNKNSNDSAVKGEHQYMKPSQPVVLHEINSQSTDESSIHGREKLVSARKLESRDDQDVLQGRKLGKELACDQFHLDTRKEGDIAINDPNTINNYANSKKQGSSSQLLWYVDGDPKAMDVIFASKQLWLSSLGQDASETSVSLHFEEFGPLEQLFCFPSKDFALVEYRNIMDAVKARKLMQGSSLWGGFLRVKFLDRGLGSRGAINGVAIGDSCHVYIGNVSNQRVKDEILHELLKVGLRNPRLVTDLTNESALLLEFGTPEEAATAIGHIRYHRSTSGQNAYTNESRPLSSCSKNKFVSGCQLPLRNNRAIMYCEEQQLTLRNSNASGYFSSNMELCPPSLELKAGNPYSGSFLNKSERSVHIPASPSLNVENQGVQLSYVQTFQSNWTLASSAGKLQVGSRKDEYGISVPMDLSCSQGPATPQSGERTWHYMKQEKEPQVMVKGNLSCRTIPEQVGSVIPPPIPTSFVRPVFPTPSSSWDSSGLNPSLSRASIGPLPHDNRNVNACVPVPFIPCSITPLSQLAGGTLSGLPRVLPPPPPPSDILPPLPSSPPPLPLSQPPSIPPPPSSPPPLQPSENSQNLQTNVSCHLWQWQGNLSKSGVHYCTVYATREESAACKYSNFMSEPAEWPARLDVTKRTDFQHVKTTFINTPPHKREVCRLLPLSTSDHKGVYDFISYLKQRECAGVIKIPAGKSIWARLLFILPCVVDFCSLLAIAPHPADCLIALVLPKEVNLE